MLPFLTFTILILMVGCSSERTILEIPFKEVKSNKEIKLSKINYKYAVIYVWSGTCVGHEKDLLRLNSLQEKLGGKIKVISLAVLMEGDAVYATFEDLNIKPIFMSLYDPKADITEAVNIITLPFTLIIDKEGNILKELAMLPSHQTLLKIIKNYRSSSKSPSSPIS